MNLKYSVVSVYSYSWHFDLMKLISSPDFQFQVLPIFEDGLILVYEVDSERSFSVVVVIPIQNPSRLEFNQNQAVANSGIF